MSCSICKKYKINRDECFDSVRIYIDNKTVVERGSKEQTLINLSDFSVPEQGLWTLTTELIQALPIKVTLKWVKGHQDENSFGEKIHGPFIKEVILNIRVDKLADMGMKKGEGIIIKKPTLSTEVIALYTKEKVQILNVRQYMVNKKNGADLESYIKEKRGWDDDTMSTIEWEGIEAMLSSVGPNRRIRLIQLIHNWQNVGSQKGRFRDARLRLDSDNPMTPTEEEVHCHKCPEGCDEAESNLHYLECPATHTRKRRTLGIKRVLTRLKKLRTYEGITSQIGHILQKISKRDELEFDWEELSKDGELSLNNAIRGQETIGWTSLCQGFHHKEWSKVQCKYYRQLGANPRTFNIARWKKMFSLILAEYSLDCWKQRNETIHGNEKELPRKKKLGKLRKQVRGLYANKGELNGHPNKKVFSMPLTKRLKMGLQSTIIWIGLAEEVLRLQRDNVKKNTLHHWLQP